MFDTINIFAGSGRLFSESNFHHNTLLNTFISQQKTPWGLSASFTEKGSRYHYSYKASNMFPKRIRYNTAVVNKLPFVTGQPYCMMNCFSLNFQFRFIGVVSPITQSWAAQSWATNAVRQASSSKCKEKWCCFIELFKCSFNKFVCLFWLMLTNGTFLSICDYSCVCVSK